MIIFDIHKKKRKYSKWNYEENGSSWFRITGEKKCYIVNAQTKSNKKQLTSEHKKTGTSQYRFIVLAFIYLYVLIKPLAISTICLSPSSGRLPFLNSARI